MAVAMPQGTANRTPARRELRSEVGRCSIGFQQNLPMRMLKSFGRAHRWAVLPQSIGQVWEKQGRHLIILNLKVVGENEAGHNIQCTRATLAI